MWIPPILRMVNSHSKGEVSQPLLYGLATEDMNYPVQLFVENTNMDVTLGNDGETIIVQNSPVNTIFQENQSKVFERFRYR